MSKRLLQFFKSHHSCGGFFCFVYLSLFEDCRGFFDFLFSFSLFSCLPASLFDARS